jgi:P27 family predicted phage terminase small subunit
MPNPPIPSYLKLIRGNPGKRPIRPEPEPAIAENVPDPPPFLMGYAADEWWRIAPELYRLRLLTVVDVMPLAVYCQSYARWRQAEEALAAMAERDQDTHGLLIKNQAGDAMQNPLVRAARHAADSMLRAASEFGLTPRARAHLANGCSGYEPPASKFDGLIA